MMAEISHSKAQFLLQAASNRSLAPSDKSALEAHLHECKECRTYQDRLTALEAKLRKTLHSKWDSYRPDLDLQTIQNPSLGKRIWNNLFSQTPALGKVTVFLALVIGYVVIANLVGVRLPISNDETPTVLPTPNGLTLSSSTSPTPQIPFTPTSFTVRDCKTIIYIVQPDDTLESIAVWHGLTKETLLEYNPGNINLDANTVFTGMELVIPVCERTPSRTASIPGNTLTVTPINGTIFPEKLE